jgi:short-subunit dehydrogenase
MNCLIIGGTSGLGLELAKQLSLDYEVHIVGTRDPKIDHLTFHAVDLSHQNKSIQKIHDLIAALPKIDVFIHAAGFFQKGTVTELDETQIQEMMDICLMSAVYSTRELLLNQKDLPVFIAVTSTSQYTPRLLEPIYTAAKAGLGAYANSLSLDPRVKKTLVVGPAGMKTKFHAGREVDMSTYLEPKWVASQIIGLLRDEYAYKYARILRDPAHVEIKETR